MIESKSRPGALPIACIVLPTFNEVENVSILIPNIFEQNRAIQSHRIIVLVVDDDSPDGTQKEVRKLQHRYPELHLITGKKRGLGEAYKRGMQFAIKAWNPDLIIEMDADLQHSPSMLPIFISLSQFGFTFIIGSRFVHGGTTPDFSLGRKSISLIGNWMVRLVGGVSKIRDCTSGFRCISTELIKKCDFSLLATRGYAFQASLLCECISHEAKIIEVPIEFPDRVHGASKLSLRDKTEFLINIFMIGFRKLK